jgi:hypothetical protein
LPGLPLERLATYYLNHERPGKVFDGTWNSTTLTDDVEQEDETNVTKFYGAYEDEQKWYIAGPSTRFGKIGRIIGGAAGVGGRTRVAKAYKQLCENWAAGDTTIDIVGFSRGDPHKRSLAKRGGTDDDSVMV